jgi:ankyrin repeat protein
MTSKHGFKECSELLLEAAANVDVQDKEGSTPLIHGSRFGHVACVQQLIDRSANVNLKMGSHDYTALHWAACNGHYDCVAELSAFNLVMEIKDKLGNGAIHLAAMNGHSSIVLFIFNTFC